MIRLTVSLIFLVPLLTMAQIADISVKGGDFLSENEYASIIRNTGVKPGVEGFADSVKSHIAAALRSNGYFHFSLDSLTYLLKPDSQNYSIYLDIDEGEPTYINKLEIETIDTLFNKEYIENILFLEGEVFSPVLLEKSISELLDNLERDGYPFASVRIESVYFYDDSSSGDHLANVSLTINRNRKSIIDKIEIAGNTDTKDKVIIRNLRLGSGRIYSREKMSSVPSVLNRLRYFKRVEEPEFYYNSKNEGVLLIKVEEKETNNFDGIVGYVPDETEGGYFTGFVNVSMLNLFGTGRAAQFKWEKLNRNSQLLNLRYREPWILGYPFNLEFHLNQRKQDTIYVQRDYGAGLDFMATDEITASGLFALESTIPTDNESSQFTVYDASTLTTGAALAIDTRNDFYSPTKGIFFRNSYKFSQKKINGPEQFITESTQTDVNIQRIESDLEGYYSFFRRQVVMIGLHAREMRAPFFEVSDLYRLGGTNTLRGYREDQFLANRLFWSNLEYRFLLAQRSYAFAFFDSGYYLRSADAERNIAKTEAFKPGYGAGIAIETGIGVLRVNYALAAGDSFSNGKIHFGILNDF